jgi:hypothetical protein
MLNTICNKKLYHFLCGSSILIIYLIIIALIIVSCKNNPLKTKKKTNNVDTTAPVLPSTITFNLRNVGKNKKGRIGFLGSITKTAPDDSLIKDLNPYYWRTGRQGDAFEVYQRLKAFGIKKQIIIMSDFRNTASTGRIYRKYGYGVLADSLSHRAKELGYDFIWDIYNEPNEMLKNNLSKYMSKYWNPAYRAVKATNSNADIIGPSITFHNYKKPKLDSTLIYKFIDAAIKANTLPDYISWHFQIGYSIADWDNRYRNTILNYIASKGKSIKGVLVGETVRPGNERNTSPAVAVDVFNAVEVYDIPQIHAAWSAEPVYGTKTYEVPVLDGLLNNVNGTGPRGVWWTYKFYAEMNGKRILCVNKPTGTNLMAGIAFRDDSKKDITAIIAPRNGLSNLQYNNLKTNGYDIMFANIKKLSGLVMDGKVHVKAWRNKQTKEVVKRMGSSKLPLILDEDIKIHNNNLLIHYGIQGIWNAMLIKISPPIHHN